MNSVRLSVKRSLKCNMKGLRFYFIAIVIIASTSHTNAQFYKRFSIELGVNRSKNYNTQEITSSKIYPGSQIRRVTITNESPSYSNNFSTAIGYRLFKNHTIKLRYSRNSIGTYISGSIRNFSDANAVGPSSVLKNVNNLITNTSWGAMYEYRKQITNNYFAIGIAVEKQFSNFEDTQVPANGIYRDNFAIHFSFGYYHLLHGNVFLYSKLFATKAFSNNNLPLMSNLVTTFRSPFDTGYFVPLQIGIELGLKFTFEK